MAKSIIDDTTRAKIKGYIEGFIQGIINEHKETGYNPKELRPVRTFSKDADIKPFHESLLPDGILRITEFERSFSTKLGTTFEECAKLIAQSIQNKSERGYKVKGLVSNKAIKRIERITNEIGTKGMRVNWLDYVKEIVALNRSGPGQERVNIADVFVLAKDDVELFFEIKSPKPNKGQCIEIASRLLQIQAITHDKFPKVKAFFAMAYNPYGNNKSDYKHSFALNYMDMEHQVLIGKEFWDFIGGVGTYEELLSIYLEVGKEKGPNMIDQLALGF